jgi:hypothetical protein
MAGQQAMKLAYIPPVSLLDITYKTKYQLMLPHLTSNSTYAAAYYYHCYDKDTFVILDNGVAEGEDVSFDHLMSIANSWHVDEIVLPDILTDLEGTITKAEEFAADYSARVGQEWDDFRFMFVLQGKTIEEVYRAAKWADRQDWISTVGIPRHLLTTLGDYRVRIKIANDIQAMGVRKDIHFLGGNPVSTTEVRSLSDPRITNQAFVRGMDTSMPFNYAFKGRTLDSSVETSRPDNYFDRLAEEFDPDALEMNLKTFELAVQPKWGY